MNFDRLAPHYRWMEAVCAGRLMQRCRRVFLGHTRSCRHALLAGDGPGVFLETLLASNPDLVVTSVDLSAGMMTRARARMKCGDHDTDRVRFIQADAREWEPPAGAFDLIVTHFFLDCFCPEELAALTARWAAAATRTALWMVADFQQPLVGWRRYRARIIVALLYAFFRLTTGLSVARLTPPDSFLRGAGFRLIERRNLNWGLLHSDLWQKTGVWSR